MEIEIRAFIENEQEIEQKLINLGAQFLAEKEILDIWFCDKNAKHFDQIKQDKPGSFGLRLRKEKFQDKIKYEINCKVLEKNKDHNAFHEFETEIKNFKQMEKILKSIGFKDFCTVNKKRKIFQFKNCKINIEKIEGFRPAIELEIISDKDIEKHKNFLQNILNELNIKQKDKIEKSITFLYMSEFCFK